MQKLVITALIVAIPTFLYAWLVRRIDRFEKEPISYLIGAGLWGAIPSIILALILQIIFDTPIEEFMGKEKLSTALISSALSGPIIEEVIKAIAIAIIYYRFKREFDGWIDGIVYGSTIGFGFAYVENIFYLMGTNTTEEWLELFFARVIVLGFSHGFYTSLTGIGFGLARNQRHSLNKTFLIAGGLTAAITAHLIHNGAVALTEATQGLSILVALANYIWLGIIIFCLNIAAGFYERNMLKIYLKDEVPQVISQVNYEGLYKGKTHILTSFRGNYRQNRAFIQIATELAQKKFQLCRMGEEGGNSKEIEELRAKLPQIQS